MTNWKNQRSTYASAGRVGCLLAWCCASTACGSNGGSSAAADLDGSSGGLAVTPARGVFEGELTVAVTHPTASVVTYTLDGSDPRASLNATTTALPAQIAIDPFDTSTHPLAPGVILRAFVPETGVGALPGSVTTHTYLFPDQAADLSPDGQRPSPDWPAAGATNQVIDYGLDPDVLSQQDYGALLPAALRALPAISLATDLDNLFDEQTGIYVNANQDGIEWERLASMELVNSDGSQGFQVNAGLRIRGGFSRTDNNPKHAFRLFFRGEYGAGKLNFPLFEGEGATEFDKIDLRTSQNYSWSFQGNTNENTMNRDVFSRDLQRELGQPYTRSRYYHLYINGYYWGIYQSQERPEEAFAETYFGATQADYDVVKVDADADHTIQATNGTLDLWQQVYALTLQGFASNANYYTLEGRNAAGERDANLPVLVDVDNLIDYMMVIFYACNLDAPVSKFFDNQNPNNFFTVINHTAPTRGFVFFAHDAEHTLLARPVSATYGVEEDRVNIGDNSGAFDANGDLDQQFLMTVDDFQFFHPQWLHHRLADNETYRQRFGARARASLSGSGPLTPARAQALFTSRAAELELAIVAESARWGDAHASRRNDPRTRDDDWVPAVARVTDEFLSVRTQIVIDQLTRAGLY